MWRCRGPSGPGPMGTDQRSPPAAVGSGANQQPTAPASHRRHQIPKPPPQAHLHRQQEQLTHSAQNQARPQPRPQPQPAQSPLSYPPSLRGRTLVVPPARLALPLVLALLLLPPAPTNPRLPYTGGLGLGVWGVGAIPADVSMIEYPAMKGWDSPELPKWDDIMNGNNRKVYVTGDGSLAFNSSVLTAHSGGLYDHAMVDHLKTSCESPNKPCKRKVCSLVRGDWCKDFFNQEPIPWQPAPRGDTDCPATKYGTCNGVGSCHYDKGICMCPAGWRGPDCGTKDPRPCTHRYRNKHQDGTNTTPISHAGPDGRDMDWAEAGWTASRCAGYCDEDIAMCYCPTGTKYGRVPAPPGSPPNAPPLQMGRPIGDSCKPSRLPDSNTKVDWGNTDPDDLFGPDGWCNADQSPRTHCGCVSDGLHGPFCEERSETFCINQCSGHGECLTGFCKCYDGWYGMDCSRKRASAKGIESGDHVNGRKPYLGGLVVDPPAAQDPPPNPTRRRPLIYVYDTDPIFNTKMMQYRIARIACVYRLFDGTNVTVPNNYVYSLETYWIEMLTISQHRTYDPDEADFFFVPVQLTCYLWPVLGWADHPWFGMPAAHSRAHQGSNMYLAAKRWVQQHYPFWDRRGGRDHIFMMLNDEGGCWMPTEVYNTSIVLGHWGRMDDNHVSGTAWGYDNYSSPLDPWPPYVDGDWRTIIDGHPCYTPGKDLIIPSLKPASHFSYSPLMGAAPRQRDILLYLRGDTGPWRGHWYSRGIRQRLTKLAYKHNWAEKYRIFIGEFWQVAGGYSEHLARSIFCVVTPGDGWSARAEDAILHGCIPLVIMDGVHAVFESILEWDAFAVRIKEEAVNENLPQVLLAFSPEQIERMQRRLAVVWQRFAYAVGPVQTGIMQQVYDSNRAERRKIVRPPGADASAAAAEATLEQIRQSGHIGQGQQGVGEARAQGAAAGVQEQERSARDWRGPPGHPYMLYNRYPVRSDAWHTIMAWLYSRIPYTR